MLGETPPCAFIWAEMADRERRNLASLAEDLAHREVRPTVQPPFRHVAGYALGAATALLGREGAMACTEALEEVTDGRYARQERVLGEAKLELRERRSVNIVWMNSGTATPRTEGTAAASGYRVLRRSLRASTRLAIWLSERV